MAGLAFVENKAVRKGIAVAGLILVYVTLVTTMKVGGEVLRNELSKEVNLQQVTVKGQSNFYAKVQLIYKDGKLDTVTLVSKTTVPEVVKTESEEKGQ
jgi:hypothetical protein